MKKTKGIPSIPANCSLLFCLICANICLLMVVECKKSSTPHQSHGPLFSNRTASVADGKSKGGIALIAADCPNAGGHHHRQKRQFANCHYRLGFVGVAAAGPGAAGGAGASQQFRQYNGAAGAQQAMAGGGQAVGMPQGAATMTAGGGMPGGQPTGTMQQSGMPQANGGGAGGYPGMGAAGGGYPGMGQGMGAAAGGGGGMGMGMGGGGPGGAGAPQRQPPPGGPTRDAALKLVMDALLAAAVPPPMGARHKFARMKMKRMRKF